jgi:hypothetical protein
LNHYTYVGGGFFRDSSAPKGTPAKMLHGDEMTKPLYALLKGLLVRLDRASCAGVELWSEYQDLKKLLEETS